MFGLGAGPVEELGWESDDAGSASWGGANREPAGETALRDTALRDEAGDGQALVKVVRIPPPSSSARAKRNAPKRPPKPRNPLAPPKQRSPGAPLSSGRGVWRRRMCSSLRHPSSIDARSRTYISPPPRLHRLTRARTPKPFTPSDVVAVNRIFLAPFLPLISLVDAAAINTLPSSPLKRIIFSQVHRNWQVEPRKAPWGFATHDEAGSDMLPPYTTSRDDTVIRVSVPLDNASHIFNCNEVYDAFISGLEEDLYTDVDLGSNPTAAAAIEQQCSDPQIRGDIISTPCRLVDSLAMYVQGRPPGSLDQPERDLNALHPIHFLRRSTRIQDIAAKKVALAANTSNAPCPSPASTKSALSRAFTMSGSSSAGPSDQSSTARASSVLRTAGPSKARKRPAPKEDPAHTSLRTIPKRAKLDNGAIAWNLPKGRTKPTAAEEKWLHPNLTLRVEDRGWHQGTLAIDVDNGPTTQIDTNSSPIVLSSSSGTASTAPPLAPPKKGKNSGNNEGRNRPRRQKIKPELKVERALAKSNIVAADGFSLIRDASFSSTGWQGVGPPKLARKEILSLYREGQGGGAALIPYLKYFYPVHYKLEDSMTKERSAVLLDDEGRIFMFRSYRVQFLHDEADAIAVAHDILVGNDLKSEDLEKICSSGDRGGHMPIIIGHQRQSAVTPRLTAWHERNLGRVKDFMELPIVTRIIGLVTDVVTTMFPGVAKRFLEDAKWHEERYGIKPMFGLFWNFCLNAWFEKQKRIHCDPHADMKNQIGVCVLLIYVLRGANFNHTQRTWLVVWEAGIIIELPPWVLAMYPSALLYHFNIDIDQIQFVMTDGNVRPTPENSRPIVAGDEHGRGSFVFFNQSTMRHGPGTGFNSLKDAKKHGLSGTVDFGTEVQEALERHLILTPIASEDVV
ncbi:hypothetical protein C8R46DRAFT_1206918 [Mycena filopes]|nr:hypothetical protein C8R46DRAFT_1206918 [Mycena filopes]